MHCKTSILDWVGSFKIALGKVVPLQTPSGSLTVIVELEMSKTGVNGPMALLPIKSPTIKEPEASADVVITPVDEL